MGNRNADILMNILDHEGDPYIRQAVAFHEDANEEVLMKAIGDDDYMVRLYAIHNTNSTVKVLTAAINAQGPNEGKLTKEQVAEREAVTKRLEELFRKAKEPEVFDVKWRISAFKLFSDKFGNPHSVLYPSCDTDASPARAFTNVTFVDINEYAITALQKEGFNAIATDIRNLERGQEFDLVILLNPGISADWATKYLTSGGYVVANNYHGSADELQAKKKEFELVGVIHYLGGEDSKPTFENAGNNTKIDKVDDLYVFRKR